MTTRTVWLFVPLALAGSIMLAACGGGGADSRSEQTVTTKSTGQELLDLKAAYDAGAISEKEYQAQKAKILKKSN